MSSPISPDKPDRQSGANFEVAPLSAHTCDSYAKHISVILSSSTSRTCAYRTDPRSTTHPRSQTMHPSAQVAPPKFCLRNNPLVSRRADVLLSMAHLAPILPLVATPCTSLFSLVQGLPPSPGIPVLLRSVRYLHVQKRLVETVTPMCSPF
jgi:hypothetical protein